MQKLDKGKYRSLIEPRNHDKEGLFLTMATSPKNQVHVIKEVSKAHLTKHQSIIEKNKEEVRSKMRESSRNSSKGSLEISPRDNRNSQYNPSPRYNTLGKHQSVIFPSLRASLSNRDEYLSSSRQQKLPFLSPRVARLSSKHHIPVNKLSPIALNLLGNRYKEIKKKLETQPAVPVYNDKKVKFQKFKNQLFKGLLYSGEGVTQEDMTQFLNKDNKELKRMFHSRKRRPERLATNHNLSNKKKFSWSSSKNLLTRKKKKQNIFERNLIEIPDWLKNNSDFKDSLKQRLKVKKSKLFKIVQKYPHLRSSEEKQQVIAYLEGLDATNGMDYQVLVNVSENLMASRYVDKTFIFKRNEIPKEVYIIYQGRVQNCETGEIYKPGNLIFMEFLEDSKRYSGCNFITVGRTILFSLSKITYQEILSGAYSSRRMYLRDRIMEKGFFKDMKADVIDLILHQVTYIVKAKGDCIISTKSKDSKIYFLAKGEIKKTVPMKLYDEISIPDPKNKNKFKRKLFSQTYKREILEKEFTFINLESSFLQDESKYSAHASKDSILMMIPYNIFVKFMSSEEINFTKNICTKVIEKFMADTKKFLVEQKRKNKDMSKVLSNAYFSQIDAGNINQSEKLEKLKDMYSEMAKREISSVYR